MDWLIYWKFFHDYWNRLLIRQLTFSILWFQPTWFQTYAAVVAQASMTTQITALMTTAQMALTTKVSALQLIQVDAQWILSGCSNKSTKNFYDHQLVPSRGYQRFPMSVVTFLKKLQQSAEKTCSLCLLLRPANPSLVGPLRASPLEGE